MNLRIALDVPEDEFYIGMIRQIGRTLVEHHDCTTEDADDLELVVGELCGNVTRHGRSEEGCYCVTLEHHGDHVVIVVADQGKGFPGEALPPMGSARQGEGEAARYGGFGLHLVESLTDQLDIQASSPQGTTVRAKKRLRQAAAKLGLDC